MAKQLSGFIVGEIEGICFYKNEGVYLAREKSSLDGKRFWKDKAFEGSRKSCKRFGEGNMIASKLYRMIEREKKVYRLFCFLKSRAILMLKAGVNVGEVEENLMEYLVDFGFLAGTVRAEREGGRQREGERESVRERERDRTTPIYIHIKIAIWQNQDRHQNRWRNWQVRC